MASGGLGGGGLFFGGRVVAVIGLGGDGGGALVKITWRGFVSQPVNPTSAHARMTANFNTRPFCEWKS